MGFFWCVFCFVLFFVCLFVVFLFVWVFFVLCWFFVWGFLCFCAFLFICFCLVFFVCLLVDGFFTCTPRDVRPGKDVVPWIFLHSESEFKQVLSSVV